MTEDLLIVAAGMGTRLRAKGNLKPLVELDGTPMIEHAMDAAFAAGMKRATVVTGYHADVLEEFLDTLADKRGWQINTVHNPDFMYPNGLSVLKAASVLDGPFCLAMCDHLVEPKLYQRLLATALKDDEVALAIDKRLGNPYVDIDDVTKVRLSGRHIKGIGKDIPVYNAFDCGIFSANPALFEAIEKGGRETNDYSISGGMMMLAAESKAIGVDVGDAFWIDVDCPEMHTLAQQWIDSGRNRSAAAS